MPAVLLAEPSPAPPAPSPPEEPQPRRAVASYYDAARSPIASLLFVLPFLAVYELGVRVAGPAAIVARNPADTWMRLKLMDAGWTGVWTLPALIVGTLILWETIRHIRAEPQASINGRLMVAMLVEAVSAAWVLVLVGQACGMLLRVGGLMSLSGEARSPAEWAAACVGAGLYEETLFRLWGLPALYVMMRGFLIPQTIAAAIAVLVSSLLFAAAHYIGGGFENTAAEWFGFGFRFAAGVAFAALLVTRGFGVAVGAHVIYDATVLMIAAL